MSFSYLTNTSSHFCIRSHQNDKMNHKRKYLTQHMKIKKLFGKILLLYRIKAYHHAKCRHLVVSLFCHDVFDLLCNSIQQYCQSNFLLHSTGHFLLIVMFSFSTAPTKLFGCIRRRVGNPTDPLQNLHKQESCCIT